MALVIKDRVKETTTTTGSSDAYVLAGAVSGFETFTANLSNADTTYYVCTDNTDFEVGLGTFASSGTTLARTTILASSNSNNAVNWSSGTRTIFMTYPADKAVFEDADGHVSIPHDLFIAGGLIDLKNDGGDVSKIKFYCESSNAHAQTLIGAPHSAQAANTLRLPDHGAGVTTTSDLVATTITQTLTNKTLTSPTINAGTLSGDFVTASNGNIQLSPNGTGVVRIDGSNGVDIQSGGISIKNSGAQSYVRFYCESSNAHYVQLQAPAHDDFSGNHIVTLPNLASTVATTSLTETLTNKTLTSPKINEDVAVTATATEINLLDGVTATTAELNILDGVTSTTAELNILDGVTSTASELNILDGVTATTSELNILDGVTATTSELNILDGVTSTTAELNILDGVTATASELNIMDGVTSTTAELNILDGVTATASELNIMDGVTATTAELNHSDGVTSNIQTQMDTKASKGFATAMAIAL